MLCCWTPVSLETPGSSSSIVQGSCLKAVLQVGLNVISVITGRAQFEENDNLQDLDRLIMYFGGR